MNKYPLTLRAATAYLQEVLKEKYPYLTDNQVKNVLTESLVRNIVKNAILDMVDFILQNQFELIKK